MHTRKQNERVKGDGSGSYMQLTEDFHSREMSCNSIRQEKREFTTANMSGSNFPYNEGESLQLL